MKMNRYNYFLILFLFLVESLLTAETDSLVIEHISTEQGLSHKNTNCIMQDSYGFLWIGTSDGLNRYDGYEFIVYKNDTWDSTSLSNPNIKLLKEDERGNIWIGTNNGLNLYERQTDSFIRFIYDPTNKYTISKNVNITAILVDHNNSNYVWIGTEGGGLNLFDTELKRFYHLKHDPNNHNSLSGDKVHTLFQDSFDNFWIGTSGSGLNRVNINSIPLSPNGKYDVANINSIVFEHYLADQDDNNSYSTSVSDIYEDRNRALWILTGKRLLNFNRERNILIPSSILLDKTHHYHEVLEDRKGMIWLGAHNRVFQLNKKTNKTIEFILNNKGTRGDGNQGLYEDSFGNIWVATWDGIVRINRDPSLFELYYHNVEDPSLPASNDMYSILADGSNRIWIGTYRGLLVMKKDKDGSERFINYSILHNLNKGRVGSLAKDSNGFIWAILGYSLVKIDPKNNSIVQYRNDTDNLNTLSFQKKRNKGGFQQLFIDDFDNLWISAWGGGISKTSLDELSLTNSLSEINFSNYFTELDDPLNSVNQITMDKMGFLWICTFDAGVIKFDPEAETFVNYKNNPINSIGLSTNSANSVHEDKKGNIWIGTYGGGLNRFDRETESFSHLGTKEGLPSDIIRGILEDDNGNLWISSNRGLTKYDPNNNSFRNYKMLENQISYRDTLTGKMYFGNDSGLNIFHPDSIKRSGQVPQVVITKFIKFSDEIESKPIIESNISARNSIELSYRDYMISFEFAALSFNKNNICEYAYKLDGLKNEWIQLGTKREVTFTKLDPGDYTFNVKACNADGEWCDKNASIRIYISPPWWETWWAYTFYGSFFIGFIFSVRKFEMNRKQEKTKLREAELKTKITEAEKRALSIENERKTRELEKARQLQLSMLPKEIPNLPNLDIAAYMKTATEVGGDYYDFIKSEDDTLNIVIGDATGHGIDAGMMVSVTKGLFQNLASCSSLEEVINQFNHSLYSMKLQPMYMTLRILRIKDSNLDVIGAGMFPFLIYNPITGDIREIESTGPPLGAFPQGQYSNKEIKLAKGDVILLMTDGFTERRNDKNEMIGDKKSEEILREISNGSANEIIQRFVKECDAWGGDIPQDDDVTFIAIKMK